MTRRLLRAGLIVAVLGVVYGCGPKTKVVEEVYTDTDCYPEHIGVDVNSGSMDVYWHANCDRIISGYNIYISERPLATLSIAPELINPFNRVPYTGDTDPDDETVHFAAEGLEDGERYYVSVRIVNPDLSLSRPTEEIVAVPGPRREIELSIRYKSEQDGFSLDGNAYTRADATENDLYFYSNGSSDYLASPVELNGFLRGNKFARLSFTGEFERLRNQVSEMSLEADQQRVEISQGDWIHVLTEDNTHALVRVLGFDGSGEDRKVRLFVAYCPREGELTF